MNFSNKRVLVTGATGFIGNRLVEILGGMPGVEIRALIHQFMNASRIARYPIAMFGGSLLDRTAVGAAMDDVDVVFHLAFGTRGSDEERFRDTVEGARVVGEEALRRGVKRFVYTSTFSVYGETGDGDLTEQSARKLTGDVYADSKLEAERVVLDLARTKNLPAVVLQPTIVYGPFSFWSRWPIEQLRDGIVVLPDHGGGLCNAVYVDDVVNALLLAASVPNVEGEVFLVSGERPCTWAEYYSGFSKLIAGSEIKFEPADAIEKLLKSLQPDKPGVRSLVKRVVRSPRARREIAVLPVAGAAYRGVKRLMPETWQKLRVRFSPPVNDKNAQPKCYPLPQHLSLLSSRTHVRIDRAIQKLGYRPQTNLAAGQMRSGEWAKWFGLIS